MSQHEGLLITKWNEIRSAANPGEYIRVDPSSKLAQYCGIGTSGNLQFLCISQESSKLLSGTRVIRISNSQRPDGKHVQIFELTDDKFQREFLTLSADMYEATLACLTEKDAINAQATAYLTWAKFFQPAAKMSVESARGLFAELLTLKDYAIPKFGQNEAVNCWRGPLGGHQDFVFGNEAVEVKSVHSDGIEVKISSEHQLTFDGDFTLRIYKIADSDNGPGTTLSELVTSISSQFNGDTKSKFLDLVSGLGFSLDEPLCATIKFLKLDLSIFDVKQDGFPSIKVGDLPPGIGKVSYSLALHAIKPYAVENE